MNNKAAIKYPDKGFSFSLRSKMLFYFGSTFAIILIILKLVEIYGIPFTTFRGEYKERQSEVFQSLNLTADLKKERLMRWLEERKDDTKVLSESRIIKYYISNLLSVVQRYTANGFKDNELWTKVQKEKVYQDLTQHLNLVKTAYLDVYAKSVYDRIRIADGQTGTIIASTRNNDLGTDVSHEKYFSIIMETNYKEEICIHEYSPNHKPQLDISRTIEINKKGTKALAVLIVHINIDDFITPMLHTGGGLGQTGEVLLVNQDVEILTSLKFPLADGTIAKPLEYQIQSKPATLAAHGQEGIITGTDYRGEQVLAAYRYLRITSEMGWGMVVKRDQAEIFAYLRKSIYYTSVFGIIGILMIFGLTTVIANSLSRPIRHLSQTAQQIQAGNLDARALVVSSGEIGFLATVFNSMIQGLQDWHEKLEDKVKARTAELDGKNEELRAEITERKQAEEERDHLNRKLKVKNKELEQIIYVTSHDLRSPLVNIQGFSKELQRAAKKIQSVLQDDSVPSRIKKELADALTEDMPEALTFILSSIAKMDSLLSGLLKISRFGRIELVKKQLDMNTIIADVLKEFEFQIKEENITVQIDDLPATQGDGAQINQLFSNLLGNAIKYLDPKREGIIKISAKKNAGATIYCIEDNGIGIDKEHQDKIFEIFHRLHPDKDEGEGLGLSIVRKILDQHSGKIWVESELGKGSRFYVSLPGDKG